MIKNPDFIMFALKLVNIFHDKITVRVVLSILTLNEKTDEYKFFIYVLLSYFFCTGEDDI